MTVNIICSTSWDVFKETFCLCVLCLYCPHSPLLCTVSCSPDKLRKAGWPTQLLQKRSLWTLSSGITVFECWTFRDLVIEMSLPIRAIVNFVTKDPETFLGAARNVRTSFPSAWIQIVGARAKSTSLLFHFFGEVYFMLLLQPYRFCKSVSSRCWTQQGRSQAVSLLTSSGRLVRLSNKQIIQLLEIQFPLVCVH